MSEWVSDYFLNDTLVATASLYHCACWRYWCCCIAFAANISRAIEYLLLKVVHRAFHAPFYELQTVENILNLERHWNVVENRKEEKEVRPSKPISGICFQDISNVGLGTVRRPRVPVRRPEQRPNNVEKWISDIYVQFCQWVSRPVLHTECERWNPGLIAIIILVNFLVCRKTRGGNCLILATPLNACS